MTIPRGIRNCNPGNLRESPGDKTKWLGERTTDDDKAFEEFTTMEYGIRALLMTLRSYINKHQCNTIRKIINRFAPSNENDTGAYIRAVEKSTGLNRDMPLDANKNTLTRLAGAIIEHENGGMWGITPEQINRAWEML